MALGVRDLAVCGTWDVLWWRLVVALHEVNFGRPGCLLSIPPVCAGFMANPSCQEWLTMPMSKRVMVRKEHDNILTRIGRGSKMVFLLCFLCGVSVT